MKNKNRRDFLRASAEAAGAAAALNVMPLGILQALAIPANNRRGSIEDIEHIVVLMQENRSFDHYFGTLRGVRGYGDKSAVALPNGKPVFHQPTTSAAGELLPFHPDAANLGLQFLQGLPHDWVTGHAAFNGGLYDQWVPAKGTTTMAYLQRADIPFHYQLADAFTICDACHCSINSSTDPNRYYMWTGYVGNDGTGGGPVVDNAEAGYGWSTFPEVLERAGISWKVYQDIGTGLDAKNGWGWTDDAYIGNYGDNSLLYFTQYQNAQPGSALYEKARRGTNAAAGDDYFTLLKRDVANGTLPQVSWIVAPEAFSEHPEWPANYGAWYVDQVLQALTSNPEVWSKTALIINYDENDGFFDHVVPPFPPASSANGLSTVDTASEIFPGNASYASGPYGLGARVPMLVVSPWSRGGWVCSETFDHTSVIRFIQKRFGRAHGLAEPNISPWRRAICGDLTSAFDFRQPNAHLPTLPATSAYAPPDKLRHAKYQPVPPDAQTVPQQEPGVRPARALPYELFVRAKLHASKDAVSFDFINTGSAGAVFLLYRNASTQAPRSYTVEARKRLADRVTAETDGSFDFVVHGPNGFVRRIAGTMAKRRSWWSGEQAEPDVAEGYDVANGNLQLRLENRGTAACTFSVSNAYAPAHTITRRVRGGDTAEIYLDLRDAHGWYDVEIKIDTDAKFLRRLAGHVETGRDSMSDPALGA
ncbi:phospholipase C, phosphocholine-specific [Caballeronia sp. LZ065]|uniref:phosphocholine-specific phospholipase C n=1 Tax=Caballeronia sp. LZ065 TaxID=3038571 RepID=UPI0028620D85|nr:phospholipase C, phosphocholine-specific [Caballeronia sp. LZ065]MDR5781716.1 phospholipase C, phosphocholine-specific [Caballeronia sp. LZ065]